MYLIMFFVFRSETLWLRTGHRLLCDSFVKKADMVLIYRNEQAFALHQTAVDWPKTQSQAVKELSELPEPATNGGGTQSLPGEEESLLPGKSGFIIQKLDVKDAGIIDLLRFLADMVGFNLVIDSSVPDTKATYLFKNIPWEDALQIILSNAELDCEIMYGAVRVTK